MNIQLHNDCFKVDDPRIERVKQGRLSAKAFALLLGMDDPFILIGSTVYPMTEEEFYATRSIKRIDTAMELTFKRMMELKDLSFLTEEDRKFVEKVKDDLPTCPSCRYKRYRQAIYRMAVRYGIQMKDTPLSVIQDDLNQYSYPAVHGTIEPHMTRLLQSLYKVQMPERKPCMDCVEKHLAQAYVLSREALLGYPEHRVLMCGHLAEASEETPKECEQLRLTIQTCLAMTIKTGEPFMPFYSLLKLLTASREALNQTPVDDVESELTKNEEMVLEVEITEPVRQEIEKMGIYNNNIIRDMLTELHDFLLRYKISPSESERLKVVGKMALASESLAPVYPALANLIRQRRLMFGAAPETAVDAGMAFDDVLALL